MQGLKRPGTVSLALPYPPSLQGAASGGLGDETLAGVGIASARKTWTVLLLVSGCLFLMGAVAVWASVTPRGPAEPDAPVVIAAVTEVPEEAVDLPAELPEGVDLDALVERAVPAPVPPEAAPEAVPEPVEPEAVEPEPAEPAPEPAPTMRTTMRATMRTTMREPVEPALPPTYPPVEPSPPPPSNTSVYNAATYGPAARRTVARRYVGDIEGCFNSADGRSAGFSGTVLVAYMLTQDGQVASARIARNTTGDSQLGSCLTTAARGWRLPPPPPRTLEFSMSFSR